jgi:hypothetical protein
VLDHAQRAGTAAAKIASVRDTRRCEQAFIPITDELRAAIDTMGPIKHLTFLHTHKGAPRSAKARMNGSDQGTPGR